MEPSEVLDAAAAVAQVVFPALPVGQALLALGELFGKPVTEITEAELDVYQLESLKQQRANLR